MRISASDLGWNVRGHTIVSGVTLEIAPGETFGLVGPNGSGKSTLLRLLCGLAPRPAGSVMLDGKALTAFSRREIARRVALVEQQADTADALSVRDVVELGRTPWLSPLAPFSAEDGEIVADALRATGMEGMADRAWSTLSGGERQRVHIARALAQRPRLLFLDEPTNHLDIHHQLLLLRLVTRLPVTVVMAIHDLNQAMGCDRLGVMEAGRMVACGPPRSVMTPERLAGTFRVGARALDDAQTGERHFRFHCLED